MRKIAEKNHQGKILKKGIQNRIIRKYKLPETEISLLYLRNRIKSKVARVQ